MSKGCCIRGYAWRGPLLGPAYWKVEPSEIISSRFLDDSIACASFKRLAAPPPMGRVLLSRIALTSYRLMSKFVTAFRPRNFIAAMS